MAINLVKSVGEGGANAVGDVRAVQAALNLALDFSGVAVLTENGLSDAATIEAIKSFQRTALKDNTPSGLIKPHDATIKALAVAAAVAKVRKAAGDKLSGSAWWHANQANYPNSAAVSDLVAGFRDKVEKFIAAMRKGGAVVTPNATLRNKTRAHLMHYCFRLSKGQVRAKDIPKVDGLEIVWDHGDEKLSRKAAKEMVDLFDIVFQPSLNSLHIQGKAIDMNISWSGTIKVTDAKGKVVQLGAPANGSGNTVLHGIGATYGVHKLLSDAPHWSSNGH